MSQPSLHSPAELQKEGLVWKLKPPSAYAEEHSNLWLNFDYIYVILQITLQYANGMNNISLSHFILYR